MKKSVILVLIYFGMQLLAGVLAAIPCTIYILTTGGSMDELQSMVLAPSLLLGVALMTLFLWKRGHIDCSKASWSPLSASWLGLTLVLFASGIWLIDLLIFYFDIPDLMESSFDLIQSDWIGILSIALLGPILEELLFRGAVVRLLLKKYAPAVAIFLSALIFGIFHLNPAQVLGAFLMGIPLAWLYYRTGSLIPSILAHVFNNSLSVYLNLRYPDAAGLPDLLSERSLLIGSVAAVGLLIVSYLLLKRSGRRHVWNTEGLN